MSTVTWINEWHTVLHVSLQRELLCIIIINIIIIIYERILKMYTE